LEVARALGKGEGVVGPGQWRRNLHGVNPKTETPS
jgi:hypothetical protein